MRYDNVLYVVFSSGNATVPPVFDLASLDGSNGFKIIGICDSDFGTRFAHCDVNNDGRIDIIMGSIHDYDEKEDA